MMTRSKVNGSNPPNDQNDVDSQGNITGLIDYTCDEEFNRDELYSELSRLSKGRITMLDIKQSSPTVKNKKKKKDNITTGETSETASPKKTKSVNPKSMKLKSGI